MFTWTLHLGLLLPVGHALISSVHVSSQDCIPSLKFRKLQALLPNLKKNHVSCQYQCPVFPHDCAWEQWPITPASADARGKKEKHFSVDSSEARSGPGFIHTHALCLIRNYFPLRAGIWISWDVAKSLKKELPRDGGVSRRRRQITVGEKK